MYDFKERITVLFISKGCEQALNEEKRHYAVERLILVKMF